MSEPLESLTQQLIRRATEPFGLAILTGVTSSSFLFFGALVLTMDGTIPATITASERAKKGISDTSALKMWDWVFHRARKRFIAAGLLSGVSYSVASALHPDLRPILRGAAFFSFIPLPYTLVLLRPINNQLIETTRAASQPEGKDPEPGVVDKLLGDWMKYSSIRTSISAIAWSLGIAALFLA